MAERLALRRQMHYWRGIDARRSQALSVGHRPIHHDAARAWFDRVAVRCYRWNQPPGAVIAIHLQHWMGAGLEHLADPTEHFGGRVHDRQADQTGPIKFARLWRR